MFPPFRYTTMDLEKKITYMQALFRGYRVRQALMKTEDKMSLDIVKKLVDHYNETLRFHALINTELSKKKIRNENFPSHNSENIAKFAIAKKYGVMPTWDTKKGDLVIEKPGIQKQIEVKGFMSDGPSSFGPTESWDWLYFVDARRTLEGTFKVYEIKLSNKDPRFRSVKLNKNETYGEIADNNQRGKLRGAFEKIFQPQLSSQCNLIFDGTLDDLA